MCVPCKVFILIKYICIVISVIYIIILLLLITFTQYSTDMFYDVIFRYCRFIFKEIYWVGLWHAATKNTCNVKFLALFSFRSERLYWIWWLFLKECDQTWKKPCSVVLFIYTYFSKSNIFQILFWLRLSLPLIL